MTAETLIQVDCAEVCCWIANLITELLYGNRTKQEMPKIQCNTYSHQLFDDVPSIRPIQGKRLRIGMAIFREMLEKHELAEMNWISNEKKLADSLTKIGASLKMLLDTVVHR